MTFRRLISVMSCGSRGTLTPSHHCAMLLTFGSTKMVTLQSQEREKNTNHSMCVASFLVRSGKYSSHLVPLERFSDHQRTAQSTLGENINVSCLPTSLGHMIPSTSCIPYKHFISKMHGILLKGLRIQEVQRVMKKFSDLVWEYCL